MHTIYVNLKCVNGGLRSVDICENTLQSLSNKLEDVGVLTPAASSGIYFTKNGKLLRSEDTVSAGETVCLHLRIRGGKGGFGSMLRAMGSQIEKTTNKEACRDLNGRRMRDVNNEKKMIEWAKKKAEKEEDKNAKKIEKLEKKLEVPKHFFNDPEYEKSLETTQDNVEDALKVGIAAHKRKTTTNSKSEKNKEDPAVKKSKLWLGMDEDDLDTDSSDDDDDELAVIASKSASKSSAGSSSSNVETDKNIKLPVEDTAKEEVSSPTCTSNDNSESTPQDQSLEKLPTDSEKSSE